MKEIEITRAIYEQYNKKLLNSLENDAVIIGAGPAGMIAGYYLANAGLKTVVIEKKLSVGGGIWGGAAGWNVIALEDDDILRELDISASKQGDLYLTNAVEFAAGLAYRTQRAGAEILNFVEVEDIILKQNSVCGVVVNISGIRGSGLYIDPFCIAGKCVVDATGHPAEIVRMLQSKKPGVIEGQLREGFMDVETAEQGVVDKAGEVYPGLYATGMAVCAVYNIPRMGPIFGGMLKSGQRVANLIIDKQTHQ